MIFHLADFNSILILYKFEKTVMKQIQIVDGIRTALTIQSTDNLNFDDSAVCAVYLPENLNVYHVRCYLTAIFLSLFKGSRRDCESIWK